MAQSLDTLDLTVNEDSEDVGEFQNFKYVSDIKYYYLKFKLC